MTKLITDDIVEQIQEVFDDLKGSVQLLFFGSQNNCTYCDETLKLIEEVSAISDKVNVNIYDLDEDAELAKKYNVDKTPGIVIAAKEGDQITDYGIRMAGIPSGHEFGTLIQDILLVSSRDSGLKPETREYLNGLDKPVLLQVYTTPT